MTDRYSALTVILDHDIRSDDAAPLMAAIRQLRGVLDVQPGHVVDAGSVIAEVRARQDIADKLWRALKEA